ncbi:uncharacterized protein LOC114186105 [Vigna unguiculata]|uniref:uncharacterized protein LOC114186105 n=1 Tax=Vigna unguiculata TaxID=3917 RepID=UPI0010167A01|nr:uncharacterized protein LOC114186105 [Vigna unguiculata]
MRKHLRENSDMERKEKEKKKAKQPSVIDRIEIQELECLSQDLEYISKQLGYELKDFSEKLERVSKGLEYESKVLEDFSKRSKYNVRINQLDVEAELAKADREQDKISHMNRVLMNIKSFIPKMTKILEDKDAGKRIEERQDVSSFKIKEEREEIKEGKDVSNFKIKEET